MTDRILINANIHTLAAGGPSRARAVALRDGRILAIGDDLRDLAHSGTQIDDLGGATVLPGLVDAHLHSQWTATSLRQIDLFDVPDKTEAVARVAQAAANASPGAWLVGRGWAQAIWPGGAFPTAADLDAAAPHHPVYLAARSGHAAWVNSAALRIAGIGDDTPDPADGQIQRDATGRATGILLEGALHLVRGLIPEPSLEALAEMLEQFHALALQSGLTGVHDYDGPSIFAAMQHLHQQGKLALRVVKNINDPYIDHAIRLGLRWGFGDGWLRLGGLKIFADGALGPRTALMISPYEGEPDNYGIVVTDKTRMLELVSAASAAGFPSTIHAIGDKAVRDVLDVYEAVRREEALRGVRPDQRRHRIEHVQIIAPEDAGRLAGLGVIASMQPVHATSDYPMADRYWGKRCAWAYNARLQLDRGARVAFGSDSPVERFEPLYGIHAAVTRRRADGSPGPAGWYPDLRLSVHEAICGYTLGPAYAGGMEQRLGQVAPGFLADLTVLERDPYAVHPDDLLKIAVVGTMTGGQWRYRAF